MAETLILLGAALLLTDLFAAACAGMIYGILTPTRTSPARPGDVEARRSMAQSVKLELVLAGLGAALLASGIALAAA